MIFSMQSLFSLSIAWHFYKVINAVYINCMRSSFLSCQDWKPLASKSDSSNGADSWADTMCQDDDDSQTLGQPLFAQEQLDREVVSDMDKLMKNLEEALPDVPLPTPPRPQIPSPPRDRTDGCVESQPAKEPAMAVNYVATPCRGSSQLLDAPTPVDPTTHTSKAKRDRETQDFKFCKIELSTCFNLKKH